ncbi:hypothetical protein GY45DRAFT_144269 [Cubamyces sp. BRFM 1775]|nr:hypothetical protein GY45DRAFT_144269 [Cubamyces sp. BRFM 1775]
MTPNCGRPLLPSDVAYLVIDQLHDDGQTVKTCSLVCREWLPRSRCHLFRDVVVKSNHEQGDFTTFLEFVVSSHHAGEYIRNLTLQGENPPPPGEHWPRPLLPGQHPQISRRTHALCALWRASPSNHLADCPIASSTS